MRILMLHCQYQIRGGEDESTAAEAQILRDAGHEVDLLTASNHDIVGLHSRIAAAGAALWSRTWHRRVAERLRAQSYDILHVQNFFR